MAKLLIALCFFLSFVGLAHCASFKVEGKVYCDTCRAGFETSATTYMSGANVRLECKERESGKVTYTMDGVTDETGAYKLPVVEEHNQEICEVVLVSSSQKDCGKIQPGRDRARIFLSHDNGIVDGSRIANSLGFLKDDPLPECAELLKNYMVQEEDE